MENIPKVLGESIDILADKFGSTGIHLYEVMVKGTFATSLGWGITGTIIMIIGIIITYIGYIKHKSPKDYYDDTFVFFYIIGIIMMVAGFVCSVSHIAGIVAPEYTLIINLIR